MFSGLTFITITVFLRGEIIRTKLEPVEINCKITGLAKGYLMTHDSFNENRHVSFISEDFRQLPQNFKIAFWGTGEFSQDWQLSIKKKRPDIELRFLIDSFKDDPSASPRVFRPDKMPNDIDAIVITSSFYREIIENLDEYNINPKILFYSAYGRMDEMECDRPENDINSPDLFTDFENGIVRIRTTTLCNSRCRFCIYGHRNDPKALHPQDMKPEWMYKYLVPLYEKAQIIILTSAEAIIARGAFKYFSFLCDNYPAVTLRSESNGISFSEKWQQLAVDNLIMMHFSLNAASEETFLKGVWMDHHDGGESAFENSQRNVRNYIERLKENDLLSFAPSISMVVNRDTYSDVREFAKMALSIQSGALYYFFDFNEHDRKSSGFEEPYAKEVLLELMKIERLLKDRFMVGFRLYLPIGVLEPLQQKADSIPLAQLKSEYADLDALALHRSIKGEYNQREHIRAQRGKKSLSFMDDIQTTLTSTVVACKPICASPWKQLDISPAGNVTFCGWRKPVLNLKDYIHDDAIDWNEIYNSPQFRFFRKEMINGNYEGCMTCCPLNPNFKPISTNVEHSVSNG